MGLNITNYNLYALCAESLPADDTNGHYWITGSADDYSTILFTRVDPDPDCCVTDDAGDPDDPIGDPAICASRKLGADFSSSATGSGTHSNGSLYDTNGALNAWSGTFVVTDSLGGTHTFNDGDTVTGMASGATTSVSYTGTIDWTDPATSTRYVCQVTDKLISANFTIL